MSGNNDSVRKILQKRLGEYKFRLKFVHSERGVFLFETCNNNNKITFLE